MLSNIKQVDFGETHAVILKNDGSLYSWGSSTNGGKNDPPTQISNLKNIQVAQISCGAYQSAAISKSGDLYTWGRGHEG